MIPMSHTAGSLNHISGMRFLPCKTGTWFSQAARSYYCACHSLTDKCTGILADGIFALSTAVQRFLAHFCQNDKVEVISLWIFKNSIGGKKASLNLKKKRKNIQTYQKRCAPTFARLDNIATGIVRVSMTPYISINKRITHDAAKINRYAQLVTTVLFAS